MEAEQIVRDVLGGNNRGVERIESLRVQNDGWVHVRWAINSAFNADSIRKSAKIDITEVAKKLCEAGHCDGLTMHGTFALQDQFGNETETNVVDIVLRPETMRQINWENFLFKNIYSIADSVKLHPEFED